MPRSRRFVTVGVLAGVVLIRLAFPHALTGEPARRGSDVPRFELDPSWPPHLPNNWVLGIVSSVAVDRHDHVWMLHRPRTVAPEDKDRAAPPVLEFDANGAFVQGWGGPSTAYEWPDNEHGITVDHKNNVWIGGTGANPNRSDDMLLKFTSKGQFIRQIGRSGKSSGNADTENLNRPADVFVYPKTNEAFVADGYGNHRIIVFNADTGAFKRMWGAFGNMPVDGPTGAPQRKLLPEDLEGPGPPQFGTTHGVKISNDGLLYVGDRDNRRIQIFTPDGRYVNQVFVNRSGPSAAGVGGIAFSPDRDQRFLYLTDAGNSQLVIVERKSLSVVGRIPGQFTAPHFVAADSKGNLYSAESVGRARVKKFVFKGLSSPANR